VHLVFASPVTSKTSEVGDKIALTLDQDVVLDGVVAAPKGSPATGRIVQVDNLDLAACLVKRIFISML
jgi:hypothetical protein